MVAITFGSTPLVLNLGENTGAASRSAQRAEAAADLAGQYANASTDADIPGAPTGERGALYWAQRSAAIANADTDADVPGFAAGQRGAKYWADDAEARGAAQVALAADEADRAAAEADSFADVRAAVEGAGLPYPTEFEAEAETYFAAAATAGSARGDGIKYVVNRWIKKWKDAGIYSAIKALWIMDNTLAVSRINIVNPGTFNLLDVGSGPTFTTMRVAAGATINDSLTGVKAASTSSYLDTQIPLNSLDQNDFHIGLFGRVGSASATYTFGVGDGTAGLGLNVANNGNGNRPTARAMGTEVLAPAPTAPAAYSNSGLGFVAVQRRADAANVEFIHNGIIKGTAASASVAPTVATTLKLGVASGITSGASSHATRAAWVLTRGLTASELDLFYRGVRAIIFAHHFGAVSIRPAGVAPSKVSADVVVYGWTLQGVIAAYEAARQGLDVALVGGWDDHTIDDLGGVSGNGLGLGDIKSTTALGGVVKRILDRIPQLSNAAGTTSFAPAFMNYALRELLDAERTAVSGTVALYETGGVLSAEAGAISDDRILHSMRCEDGTTFEAEYFIDCTYEGDLAGVSGVTMTWGTDTAGTGLEIPAGFVGRRAEQISYGAAGGQPSVGSTEVFLDPYVTPGNPASGLLATVKADGGWGKGAAMKTVQNYCFRQTFVTTASLQRPLPLTAPVGYDPAKFAVQERYFSTAAGMGLTPAVSDIFIPNSLPGGYQDFNNRYFLSLDIQESGTRFVQAATYNARRRLKDEYLAYTDELIYHFWASLSSAIPAATRTALQGYSYAVDHYLDPGPNDQAYKSSTLYVREARRIVGELVWDANDLAATDGTVPRSTKTVACASYDGDSHVHFLFVDTSTATTQIYGGNKLFINTASPNFINGVNKLAPLPREIFLPVREEVANLAVIFAGSWSHVAHGSIRMEFTSGQAAQSFGMLCAIAHENGLSAFMDVDDATFRTRMAALPETTPAYLPQVN